MQLVLTVPNCSLQLGTLSYLQKSLQVNCELILPGNITALLREKPELFTVLVELVLEPSQILGALRVVVEQYVGDVCVVFASLVVGLVGRGKGSLPLLAPHQRRTQEVDDGLVSVVVLQLLQVFVKGGGGELGTAGHADLMRPNLKSPSLISSISKSIFLLLNVLTLIPGWSQNNGTDPLICKYELTSSPIKMTCQW